MVSDGELLRQYVDSGSEPAFTKLVRRHINIVYRTALRRVGGDASAADDVTQRVFTALARKAPQLRSHASIVGWLYTAARFTASEYVRAEQRRRKYEQEAYKMTEHHAHVSMPTVALDSTLDEIIARLPERDREALLLHFIEQRSFVEIAAMFSSSADAVRMRVNRALERMRAGLERQGITSTATALAAAMTLESAAAAPAGLVQVVAQHALVHSAATAGSSALGHCVAAIKTSPWFTAASIGLVIVGGSLAVRATWPTRPTATRAQTVVEVERTDATTEISESIPFPLKSSPNLSATVRTAPQSAPRGFTALSTRGKNIIALLWRIDRDVMAGHRRTLRIPPQAPNSSGVAPLIDLGWIETTPRGGLVLTEMGRAYCRTHRSEIERYVPTDVRRVMVPGGPAGK